MAPVEGEWWERAACRGKPRELFVGYAAESTVPGYCDTCTVRVECLEDCLSFGYALDGVWGGTTAEDRRDPAKARAVAARGAPVQVREVFVPGTRSRHGSDHAYRVHGCRCAVCVAGQRVRWAERDRRRGRSRPPGRWQTVGA